jgi:hypothetical protein
MMLNSFCKSSRWVWQRGRSKGRRLGGKEGERKEGRFHRGRGVVRDCGRGGGAGRGGGGERERLPESAHLQQTDILPPDLEYRS